MVNLPVEASEQPDRLKISLPSSWAAGLKSISDESEENKCQT